MPAVSKYPEELKARATRLTVEARKDPDTRNGAIARIADQCGVKREALRMWVRKAEADEIPVETEDAAATIRRLEKENRELRRSNSILKSAAAFFAAEFDRPQK
ncbi:transposase [Brevibacterium sp. 5221]|uniref:Transposase n=1 Tax=Brevibacterium rongguiense TaxID=2695267 RepID=A0A6N9H3I3_9MICO|nr:transposase [Brevibacterium rongguiense]